MGLLTRTKKLFSRTAGAASAPKAAEKKPASKKPAEATVPRLPLGEVDLQLLVSEKAMKRQAGSVVVFRVPTGASKGAIATAVATQYGVKALSIRTAHMPGKNRRRGTSIGMTNDWKKAYVKVDDIQKINVAP